MMVARTALPRVRFHDLRHAHATHMLSSGVHPKVASERLGHSKVGITLDLYSHVLPGMQADAAARVDEALRAAVERRGPKTIGQQNGSKRAPHRPDEKPDRLITAMVWRGGRAVECTALEMRHTGNRIGGSNPPLSASPDLSRSG